MKTRHLAFTTLILLVTAAGIRAYVLHGPKWPVAQVPYYINPTNGDSIPESTALSDIQAAAMAWTAQSNAAISLYYMGRSSGPTVSNNGRNEVFFRNASKDAAAATTYWWSDGNNRLIDADIVVWDATYAFFGGSSGCSGGLYVQDVITHEFGHALGLAHSSVGTATMYPTISKCSTSMRSLDPDDLAGIEDLYPAAGTNSAPTVTITSPAAGATFPSGNAIGFSGSATDKEDGSLSARMTWKSNIDGAIGTGATFTRLLSAGAHTITARVTDAMGAVAETQRTITVAAPTSQPAALTLSGDGYKVKGLQRVDLSWTSVTATTIDVYRNGVRVAVTANDRSFTDAINVRGAGSYSYRVCATGTSTCSNALSITF